MAARKPGVGDTVALIAGKPLLGLRKGQIGTVVEELSEETLKVEFLGLNGNILKRVEVHREELLILYFDKDILRIRSNGAVSKRRLSWIFLIIALLLVIAGVFMMFVDFGGQALTSGGRYSPSFHKTYFGGESLLVVAVIFGTLSISFRE